jgi:GxxExxY protein
MDNTNEYNHGESEIQSVTEPPYVRLSQKYISDLSFKIIGCAIEVHKHLGPGLLESVYHQCLFEELQLQGLWVQSKVRVPVNYKGRELGDVLEIDLLVENIIVIELKAVESLHPVFKAQLLSYLKLSDKPKGLLINFHVETIAGSIVSLVTDEFAKLPKY